MQSSRAEWDNGWLRCIFFAFFNYKLFVTFYSVCRLEEYGRKRYDFIYARRTQSFDNWLRNMESKTGPTLLQRWHQSMDLEAGQASNADRGTFQVI